MEVTDIRLGLATKEGGTKAFGSFSLDGAFAAHSHNAPGREWRDFPC